MACDKTIDFDQQEDSKRRIIHLLNSPLLDEGGYPTTEALEIIELWPSDDEAGWFKFIKSLWHLADYAWAWTEIRQPIQHQPETMMNQCTISTVGWGGNEDLIRAMMANTMLWSSTWVSSHRDGYYQFEVELKSINLL